MDKFKNDAKGPLHYLVHISRHVNRQLLQVFRSFANHLERAIKDVDFDGIQPSQGFAPVADYVSSQASGECICVGLTRPDGQRLQRRLREDGEYVCPG